MMMTDVADLDPQGTTPFCRIWITTSLGEMDPNPSKFTVDFLDLFYQLLGTLYKYILGNKGNKMLAPASTMYR
jgi:hypothetical protein